MTNGAAWRAVDWVRVLPRDVELLTWRRATLAYKDVEPSLLRELGVLSGDAEVDLRVALDDEAIRMAGCAVGGRL